MKTVKRIFAVAVAVLLIAMMIPSAFAAEENTINWTCAKPGYTFTVFKVADYNATTGAYPIATGVSGITQDQINNAVTEAQMADLANACKDATLASTGKAFTTSVDVDHGSIKVDDGIYFIKCTQEAGLSKGITKQSIVVFPQKNGTKTVNVPLDDKIDEGQPKVYKDFLINGTEVDSEQTFGSDDTITYILKADVVGTKDNKLEKFIITDKMGDGLDTTVHNVTSVSLKKKDGTTVKDELGYTVTTTASDINRAAATTVDGSSTTGNTFGVSINKAELDLDTFYGDNYQVVVVFNTRLASSAKINTAIPNDDDMIYQNGSGFYVVPGETVTLKTYEVKAKKVDANTKAPITTQDAEFTLYKADGTTVIEANVKTDENGIANFTKKLAAGTYVIKETKAPAGYNLNSQPQTVTVGPANASATVVVEDTQAKLPSTGGNGTLVFTIVGGSLVLLAAALFIVVMKKRSSAK
ncbi:SpaH/EbpB family LPXTG-anchored major pilin [Ruminococcus sp.]|uniref:SpaH/EbpB family LPXTG-anchored major pilin n=1 Tax=Ruminococcus sp. TaxID=41978 RepID=UPI00388F46BB